MSKDWFGFDLDGTLARHISGNGAGPIGEPIAGTVEMLRAYLKAGHECRIFTARVADADQATEQRSMIRAWLKKHGLPRLEITCSKDRYMMLLFDDRCVQVEKNGGRLLGSHPDMPVLPAPKRGRA